MCTDALIFSQGSKRIALHQLDPAFGVKGVFREATSRSVLDIVIITTLPLLVRLKTATIPSSLVQ